MPRIVIGMSESEFCVEAKPSETSTVLDDTVSVKMRFGTPVGEVLAKLQRMIDLIGQRWGNLPGIRPDAEPYGFIPAGNVLATNEKRGLPLPQTTARSEPRIGESAGVTAAA